MDIETNIIDFEVTEVIKERLWAKVSNISINECWETKLPYQGLSIDGVRLMAHRVSWYVTYGKIPDNLYVLHKCDNPRCINPNHLFLGTQQDNMSDMQAKGRFARPWLGKKFSLETRTKMSISFSRRVLSDATRSKMSKSKMGVNLGKRLSEETKLKMSEARKGVHNPFFGKVHTEATKAKIRESTSGVNNHNYGKTFSEETRKKMSASQSGRVMSEKAKLNMREGWRKRRESQEWHSNPCLVIFPN